MRDDQDLPALARRRLNRSHDLLGTFDPRELVKDDHRRRLTVT
jgi:hypothetical protein